MDTNAAYDTCFGARAVPLLWLAGLSLWPLGVRAAELSATPADYVAQLARLGPGDTLALAAGRYPGLTLSGLSGTAGSPITVRGPAAGEPAVIVGRACCAGVLLRDVAHVRLQHLTVDLEGQPVDGLLAEAARGGVHHVTLEDLRFIGFAADVDLAGIRTRSPAWDWVVRRVVIERAGLGLALGTTGGRAPFVRGLIEQLLVVDPLRSALDVAAVPAWPALAELPGEPSRTVLRDVVFVRTSPLGPGVFPRPMVVYGAGPTAGPGSGSTLEIYGALVLDTASLDIPLAEIAARAVVHHSLWVNGTGPGPSLSGDGSRAVANTLYTSGRALVLADAAAPVVGNAVFSATPRPIVGGLARDNVVDTLGRAPTYVVDTTLRLGALDLYPRPGGGLLGAAAVDLAVLGDATEPALDFDGRAWTGTARGAYEGGAAGPAWALAAAVKPRARAPAPDAGVADASVPDVDVSIGPDADAPGDAASAPDVGVGGDAGVPEVPRAPEGCATAGPTSPALAALILAWGFVAARRPRRREVGASCAASAFDTAAQPATARRAGRPPAPRRGPAAVSRARGG